jgi:hypothetical protein
MGLAYTIDSPIRVAKYGISSVISIIGWLNWENEYLYSSKFNLPYQEITQKYTIIVQNVLLLIWIWWQNCKEKLKISKNELAESKLALELHCDVTKQSLR